MDDTELDQPKTSWGKRIAIVLGALVVLLVVAYFVGTSSPFVKSVILPKVGEAMNAKITVGDISVSPFSQLYARDLRVVTTGTEPLLTANELRVRYSLMDILKGNIKVHEITVNSPVVTLVQEPDGSSNLDPITQGESAPREEASQISIRNVSIKNGIVRQIEKGKDGSTKTTELKDLALDLDRLGNGQAGTLKLAAAFSMAQPEGGTNNVLTGDLSGSYDISLNQELLPDNVKGSAKLAVTRAEGSFRDLAGFNGTLDADLTPKDIRQVALSFARNGQQLGLVRLSGPMDVERKEGNLRLEVNSIDKNVLGLATAGQGYDFGNTRINSTNQITISQNGTFYSANGMLTASEVTLAQNEMKTPEMNLNLDYQVAINTADKSAILQRLNLNGSSGGKRFLHGELDRQMNLTWGEKVQGFRDAAMNIVLTNFNIADWRAVLGTNINAGVANATVALVSQQDGKVLKTDITAAIDGLKAQFATNHWENAALTFAASGSVEQMKIVNLPSYTASLRQNNSAVLQASGSARYVIDTAETTAQVTVQGALPGLLTFAALPDTSAARGTMQASAKYTDDGSKKTAVGNMAVADFTGLYGDYKFTNFSFALEYNVEMDPRDITLNRIALTFDQGFNRGGTVDFKGKYNVEKESGQFSFSTVDLNQNVLGPILASSLGENQLVSISLNASGTAKLDPQGESAVTAEVKVANWVVQDQAGKLPRTPLTMDMKIDGGMQKEVINLRQFLVQLTPTPRAKNALQVQGKLDFSATNPAPSSISLTSESFDVTPYYDLFTGKPEEKETAAASAPSTQTVLGSSDVPTEPEPIELPFKQLTADLKIDQLFLREVAISNWVGKLTIQSNVIQLNPFELRLNDGPVNVNGTVNVGSPGYMYDLAFRADQVPLAPLANTFGSGKSNALQGTFVADAKIRGAGTTGPNLRKNLGGSAKLNLTNLNYQVVGPKLRRILVPISIALRVPELTQTPINWVSAETDIANGTVNLKHLGVESEAFYAESVGTIALADVITNSVLNLPLDLSLRRSIAEKTGLLSSGTPTNAKYAKLPRFVKVTGTIGAPDTDINELAIAGVIARGAASLGLGNENVEKALGAVGSLLTGEKGSTNKASTNASPVGNIVNTIGGLLGSRSTKTNAPADGKASSQPATNNPVQNAIDSLLRPRPKN